MVAMNQVAEPLAIIPISSLIQAESTILAFAIISADEIFTHLLSRTIFWSFFNLYTKAGFADNTQIAASYEKRIESIGLVLAAWWAG